MAVALILLISELLSIPVVHTFETNFAITCRLHDTFGVENNAPLRAAVFARDDLLFPSLIIQIFISSNSQSTLHNECVKALVAL